MLYSVVLARGEILFYSLFKVYFTYDKVKYRILLQHSYLRDWLGNLALKTMVLQFMLEGP